VAAPRNVVHRVRTPPLVRRSAPPVTGAITILRLAPVESAGNIRAFADLQIGPLVVYGAKIVQQPGQQPWVAMPDRPWTDDAGQQRWSRVVDIVDKSLRRCITETVLAAWERQQRDAPATIQHHRHDAHRRRE
jgi:DNA-binding cell septation regulator SpoVG